MSTSTNLVLVTGATGFIGSHIVDALLSRDIKVRVSARSEASTEGLRQHFDESISSGALSFVYVPDITVDGAFDEAVRGVSGVIHAGAPRADRFKTDARKDILDPSIKGTTSILRSAIKEASVTSFILTTSGATHTNATGPTGKYTGDDTWCSIPMEQAEASDNAGLIYAAGKLYAEKEAWSLVKSLDSSFHFATVAPVCVAGPMLLPTQCLVSYSPGPLWSFANGQVTLTGDANASRPWIHVADVATAHVVALLEPRANRKRILVCAPGATVSALDIAKLARDIQPGINACAEPVPGATQKHERFEVYEGKNVTQILGIRPAGMRQIVKDVIAQGLEQRKAGLIA